MGLGFFQGYACFDNSFAASEIDSYDFIHGVSFCTTELKMGLMGFSPFYSAQAGRIQLRR
jgi:hypothetical protein